jgi:hypothetical protein
MGACFLSVTWHGEALYGLGFRVLMMFWFFLVFFFCQVWLQCLSKIFYLWSSNCLLLHLVANTYIYFLCSGDFIIFVTFSMWRRHYYHPQGTSKEFETLKT